MNDLPQHPNDENHISAANRLGEQIVWTREPEKTTPDPEATDTGECDFGGFVLSNKDGVPTCMFTNKGFEYTIELDLDGAETLTDARKIIGYSLLSYLSENRPDDPIYTEFMSSGSQFVWPRAPKPAATTVGQR